MTNLTESSAQCSPALPPASSMHLLVRLKAKDEGGFSISANTFMLSGCSCESVALFVLLKSYKLCFNLWANTIFAFTTVCLSRRHCILISIEWFTTYTWVYKSHRIITLCIERTLTWCLFFPQSLYIPMVFLAECKLIISMLCNWAGFSLIFPVIFFCMLFFLWCFQSLKIIMHFIVPVIELSFFVYYCFFLHISLTRGCVLLQMSLCVSWYIWMCVSVSAENLEKSLRQMERQLLQLERDLETFSSPDDQNDMFFTKMAISFTHACIHSPV